MVASLIAFAVLLALCFAGAPLGFAALLVGLGGFAIDRGMTAALAMTSQQIMEVSTSYGLSMIPLFILIGSFVHRAQISEDLYAVGHAWFGRLRGGLAISTVVASAGFSAVCGSSVATAATMTRVAMPSMRRYNYADSLSAGTVAAGGTLGIMIPPSVPMAIYGMVAEQDIGKLFIAGILPGLLLTILYVFAVAVAVTVNPRLGPAGEGARSVAVAGGGPVWPIGALFIVMLGGIYLGVFTPTEAAAVGAAGAAAFAAARGRLRHARDWIACLVEAASASAMIFLVAIGALVFANYVNLAGLPYAIVAFVDGLGMGPFGVVIAISLICIGLGMVFETIGILLLVIPVFLPTLIGLGVDMIWFGVIVVLVVEMGLITPPIGLNVFTVRAVMPDIRLADIFRGVVPFIAADAAALGLILFFPIIPLALVRVMG